MGIQIFKRFWPLALATQGLLAANFSWSQSPPVAPAASAVAAERDLAGWLQRLHQASRNRAYTGTFVVSAGTAMSSARIWHVCDGSQQLERVDALSGPPRTTLRRNDEVMTFVPDERKTLVERRESLGLFPAVLQAPTHTLAEFYALRLVSPLDRVAGYDTEVLELQPRDDLRFGYRIWSEKKTGLVLKLQTLDAQQRVLEQVAFSELNLDAPVKVAQLAKLMKHRPGYTVQQLGTQRTTAQAQGWHLKKPVPGYVGTAVHVLPPVAGEGVQPGATRHGASMQWVFSDGLASVSLFVEPFDPQQHGEPAQASAGATNSMAHRLDNHWLTAVGEVPFAALQQFSAMLERMR